MNSRVKFKRRGVDLATIFLRSWEKIQIPPVASKSEYWDFERKSTDFSGRETVAFSGIIGHLP
jgi:hypothetical protein